MRSKFQLAVLSGISALVLSACSAPADKVATVDMDKLKAEIQAKEDAFCCRRKS